MQTDNYTQPMYMNLQPNFTPQPFEQTAQVQEKPTQFGAIMQTKVPIGTISKNTGRLTFHSSVLFFGIVILIFVVSFPLCLSQAVTVNASSKTFIPFSLLIFVLPALTLLVALLLRKHQVEFDDSRREMILTSHFIMLPCLKRTDFIVPYDQIQDIYCEISGVSKSNVVVFTKGNQQVYLLANQNNWTGNGFSVFYNQAIAQQIREHIELVSRV